MTTKGPGPRAAAFAILALALSACVEGAGTPSAPPDEPALTPSPEASASTTAEAPTPAATASPEGATAEVTIEGSRFAPGELTISVGTEVTFVNLDTFAHTATQGTGGRAADDPVADEMLDAGASGSVTFDEPGTFEITCRFHPTMQMAIVVEA